jgi:uncharacterized protein YigA (DUF484 family)
VNIQGITEADIAQYLAHNPAFFERQSELLASVQLTSPHGQRAVSLQERQMEMLRERIKGLEARIMEMIRHGQENVAIADRLHRWTRTMLLTEPATALPRAMVGSLQREFLIPQGAVRLWGLGPSHEGQPYAQAVSADLRAFADSLTLPYCGLNSGFEAAGWLEDAGHVASLALVPLRAATLAGAAPAAGGAPDEAVAGSGCFGLLVLGSPDPTRYSADMGTDFLVRIGEIASAALARLRG